MRVVEGFPVSPIPMLILYGKESFLWKRTMALHLPGILYRYRRWIALFLALAAAAAFYFTASDPSLAAPCHGFAAGDPRRMVLSWQVSHPIDSGILSVFSLGFWPSHGMYALPGACTYRDYGVGLPMHWYNHLRADAYPTFLWTRTVFGALLTYLFCGWLLRFLFAPQPSPDVQ